MYNMYVRCNYKLTLRFKSKVLNKILVVLIVLEFIREQ